MASDMRASFPPFSNQFGTGELSVPTPGQIDEALRREPTAAISDTESKLRTALAYVNHARSLLREALGDDQPTADGITTTYDSGPRELSADFTRDRDATGA